MVAVGVRRPLRPCVAAQILQQVPVLWMLSGMEAFACMWLLLGAAATSPAAAWTLDPWLAGASAYGGLAATALNNLLLGRANKHLGSVTARAAPLLRRCCPPAPPRLSAASPRAWG